MNSIGKLVLFANTDWYLYNFRRSLALAAQTAGYDVLMLSPPGEYGERLRALGLRWNPIAMERRSLNPFRELMLLWRLVGLLRRERPTVLHGFTIKCVVYGSLVARLVRVPTRVNSVDGLGYVFSSSDIKARGLKPLVKLAMRVALGGSRARLILLNADDVKLFESTGLSDTQHVRMVCGAGVDCTRFVPRRHAVDSSTQVRVLLASRLLWDKGIREYVAAARRLQASGSRAVFLLAGAPDYGNPAAVPEADVRAWAKEGVLQWLGHVDDMAVLYASVDVVVLPSYREGLPTSLTEAAACGLPLVTCDTPGCREVVIDGVDGLLVPPRDADALAAAITRLVDDPALRAQLGQAARAKALAEFDEHIVIEKTLAVYRELLEPVGS